MTLRMTKIRSAHFRGLFFSPMDEMDLYFLDDSSFSFCRFLFCQFPAHWANAKLKCKLVVFLRHDKSRVNEDAFDFKTGNSGCSLCSSLEGSFRERSNNELFWSFIVIYMLKWTSQQIVLLVFWIAKSLQTKSLDQRFHVLTSDKPAENGNVVVFFWLPQANQLAALPFWNFCLTFQEKIKVIKNTPRWSGLISDGDFKRLFKFFVQCS